MAYFSTLKLFSLLSFKALDVFHVNINYRMISGGFPVGERLPRQNGKVFWNRLYR
jgi:hypothetical protein